MKNYLKLISMLAVALGLLLGYASIPAEWAEQLHLKQVGLSGLGENRGQNLDALLAEDESDKADNADHEETDTTTQRVLMFGDSMTGLLGPRFADYAKENGHEFLCVTWNSSSTVTWAKSDTLDHYMRTFRPTHVFVCLGSNELYTRDMEGRKRFMNIIKQKVGKVPFIWIGPPNWKKDEGYNQWILDVMGKKAYYPSLKLQFERQKDGAHPTPESGCRWMDKVVEWINAGHSIHPFRLKKTDRKHSFYQQVIIPQSGQSSNSHHSETTQDVTEEVTDEATTTKPNEGQTAETATKQQTEKKTPAEKEHDEAKTQSEKKTAEKKAAQTDVEHNEN